MKKNKTSIALVVLAALTGSTAYAAEAPANTPSTVDVIAQAQTKVNNAQSALTLAQEAVTAAGAGATDEQKQAVITAQDALDSATNAKDQAIANERAQAEITEALATKQSTFDSAQAAVDTANENATTEQTSALSAAESELNSAKTAVEQAVTTKTSELESNISTLQADLDAKQQAVDSLDSGASEDDTNTANQALAAAQTAFNTATNDKDQLIADARTQAATTQNLATKQSAFDSAKNTVDTANEKATTEQTDALSTAESELNSAKTAVEQAVTTKTSELNHEISTLQATLNAKQQIVTNAETGASDELRQAVTAAQTALTNAQKELSDLQAANDPDKEANDAISESQGKLQAAQATAIDAVQKEIAAQKAALLAQEKQKELDAATTLANEEKAKKDALDAKVNAKDAEITAQNAIIADDTKSTEEKAAATTEKAKLEAEKNALNEELTAQTDKASAADIAKGQAETAASNASDAVTAANSAAEDAKNAATTAKNEATANLVDNYAKIINENQIDHVEAAAQTKAALKSVNSLLLKSTESGSTATADEKKHANEIKAQIVQIAATGTAAQTKTMYEQLAVQSDMLESAVATPMQTSKTVISVTSNRLASVRDGAQYTGIATGDEMAHQNAWARVFGNWTNQDDKQVSGATVYGFDADTYGVAVGYDREVMPNIHLGTALTFANTKVKGNGAGHYENDTDSYQVTLYGDYTVDTYYVEGMLGYAYNNNEATRNVLASNLTADYNSKQYMASIKAGMPFNVVENTYLTPSIGLDYTHIQTDAYAESGDSILAQKIEIGSVDSVIASADLKMHSTFTTELGDSIVPNAHVGVNYELGDNNVSSNVKYIGSATSFSVKSADYDRFGVNLGAGVDFKSDVWTFSTNLDTQLKNESVSNNFSITIRREF